MSTPVLLTYALPMRQLHITGKTPNPALLLTPAEVSEAAAADGYNAASRTQSELIADLGSWSPVVQNLAGEQLATTTIDSATLAQITALANDPNGSSRIGACIVLGKTSSGSSTARAAILAALLTDPNNHVRYMAAESMRYMSSSARLSQLNAILSAAASTAAHLLPYNEEDPIHFAHGRLAMLLFYSGGAYGPTGCICGDKINTPTFIDRNLLHPAIRALAATPDGHVRNAMKDTFKNLTAADVNALGGAIVDSVLIDSPAGGSYGMREGGLYALERYKIAEGVPLSIAFMKDDGRQGPVLASLNTLEGYAGGCTTVTPDAGVIAYCQKLVAEQIDPDVVAAAQDVLDAIAANPNPAPLAPFKSIQSATIDNASVNLPANQTVLHVSATDIAQGNSVYTWRKLRGPGNVTFTPNGTAAAKDSTVRIVNNIPGTYVFEVTMSDSRDLTEVYRTVLMTLRNPDGTLPPVYPPVAHPLYVNAPSGATTPFTLTGTDSDGFPVVYSVVSQPVRSSAVSKNLQQPRVSNSS